MKIGSLNCLSLTPGFVVNWRLGLAYSEVYLDRREVEITKLLYSDSLTREQAFLNVFSKGLPYVLEFIFIILLAIHQVTNK